VVIRDSGNKNAAALEAEMAERIRGHSFSFRRGVQLCVVRREDGNVVASRCQRCKFNRTIKRRAPYS
jgi:hypothetical protein